MLRPFARTVRTRSVPVALAFVVVFAASAAIGAQTEPPIPSHPSRLEFDSRRFGVPRAEPLTHRLSNGTRVVVVEDRSLPLVDVTVALLAGAYLDPSDKPGLAEITGAMVRRGGTASRSPDAFDDAIDFLGTEIDTRATTTRAGASLDCLSDTLEESLSLFFEMLRRPGFDASRLEDIESNLLAGLQARNDDPIAVMEREWSWLLVGEEHYLGRQLTAEDVSAIARRDLIDFHARHWRPERAVIAVSGDVDTARVLALLEKEVIHWAESQPKSGGQPSWPPVATPREAPPGLYLSDHPSAQAKVSLGHAIEPIRDWLSPDAAALEVANEILGGTRGQVNRINSRLRGQGMVYRALSELDAGRFEPGYFRIFLDASPQNVVPAIEVCLEEIDRLTGSTVSPETLDTVRGELVSTLALRFDTAEEIAGYFAEDLLLGRPHEYWYGYADRLGALEPRDLRAAAARHLDADRLEILVVGGGEAATRGPSRDARLSRWLSSPKRLPLRDPLTLVPEGAAAKR